MLALGTILRARLPGRRPVAKVPGCDASLRSVVYTVCSCSAYKRGSRAGLATPVRRGADWGVQGK